MTPPPPAVSVVMPAFLRGGAEELRLLKRALDSIHAQDWPGPFEIVLVDDGSPSPVADHLPALGAAAGAVRLLRRPRNAGVTAALNAGLAAARHPLIARLDADDAWRPGKSAAQLAVFAADGDLTLTATGMARLRPDGGLMDTHVRPAEWGRILDFIVEVGCPFPHGSVIARRDIYLALGGYPHLAGYENCEDFALWSLWLRFFKPRMLEEVFLDYTVSPGAVSQRHGARQARASDGLRAGFARLGLARVVPGAMAAFAAALGLPLVEAGLLALRIWRHGLAVRLPEGALPPLRALLPDRDVEALPLAAPALCPAQVLQRPAAPSEPAPGLVALARPAP